MLAHLSLLAFASYASAQGVIGGNGNLTVSFFTDYREDECQSGDFSEGIVLTTDTVPNAFTCFTMSDLFSRNGTDVGFQNATQNVTSLDETIDELYPNGIHYLLQNRLDYDSKANYTRVWYQQVNESEAQPGEEATWVLHLYAYDDCEQQQNGDERPPEDWPWFETSCQTEEGGQCQTVPNTIRSFGINSASDYNDIHGQCEEWAFLGEATGLMPRWTTWGAVAVGVVAVLGLM